MLLLYGKGAEKEFACQVFPIFSREILGSDLELRAGFGKGFIVRGCFGNAYT